MANVFIAQYMTLADLETERDDPCANYMSLEDLASPQFAGVSLDLSDEWIAKLRSEVEQEVRDAYGDEDEDLADEEDFVPQWVEAVEHHKPEEGREHWIHTLQLAGIERSTVAKLVIQKEEVYEQRT